jgi:3-methyladenine DNA glycosylase AlkD
VKSELQDISKAGKKLLRALRQSLRYHADPAKAPIMQAYMKSAMPYLGVQTPEHRRICRQVFRAHPLDSFENWRDTVLTLWREAQFREERYAAIALAAYHPYRDFRTVRALPLYKEMITTGAWWDYVDPIATRQIGELLRKSPERMALTLRKWAVADDIWLRRSAILAQLNFKTDTDLALLYDCIRPSLGRPEFFLQKAMGWALRQYARTDPEEVLQYVQDHRSQLSALSMREALKHLSE